MWFRLRPERIGWRRRTGAVSLLLLYRRGVFAIHNARTEVCVCGCVGVWEGGCVRE